MGIGGRLLLMQSEPCFPVAGPGLLGHLPVAVPSCLKTLTRQSRPHVLGCLKGNAVGHAMGYLAQIFIQIFKELVCIPFLSPCAA